MWDVLFLRLDARLGEVVLEMFNTPEGHDALPLRGTAAEWFRRLVRRVHVRVERELAARAHPLTTWRSVVRGGVHSFLCSGELRGKKEDLGGGGQA
jgi:hypothetical protein